MVISSIDLKNGKVVQLKNGKDTIIERDDADALIREFDKYGETAVIDLDAALGNMSAESGGNGATVNTPILKQLLRKGNVRVGGGIKTVKKAKELISLGAEKIIIGSAAWADEEQRNAGTILNTAFLDELTAAVGRQRIIISVDAINGKIAVKGWTETNGIPLIDGARAAEQYAGELLFTCVEKEGCMQGTDMEAARQLREAVSCRVTIAGGISTLEEIVQLEQMGCDVQLGMALYTGKISLKDAFISCLNWRKAEQTSAGLIPVIAQSPAKEVLMMGFASREAFEKTFASGKLTFWSRTRQELWTKGEHSGHYLSVQKLRADCDRDTVLATVEPHGGVCHTGSFTCFGSEAAPASTMERLYAVIADRFANPSPGSYTATLDDERVREKIEEEAEEVTEADSHDDVVWECADLLYFLNVLMYKEHVTWQEVYDELDRRHKK
ncbi:MAG: bifunctional phosphoribosyl-AMP cyclohydrolase/phosphoribosyl-ATP diphosphatase HisIE [Bacteroides sp.]|nr:bifunctional phosphoribosyl-AMP cyclohydrolase/phosphoribosyl-ATP diphosphatase HisIE [Prevotella sp.]MCM1407743.1 bifunctional phosphoribosyl-AMP cyclohydrolase/phosphoribosyl-ATP diphosphatase HisIE [Treponema brennaborense]MCM1469107.1 bifunctional phosphoribosyl-AMP cyclohydrolase/phosphoribosyl-ATP diphosphatase HisIE [Bacteroides sp.]